MTTEAAPVTLTYNSTDVQDLDGIFLEIVRGAPGEPAEVRGRDDVAIGREGRMARNRLPDVRIVELVGWIRGTGADEDAQRSDYWDNRITFDSLFSTTTIRVLHATLPNGDAYTLNCRVRPPVLFRQVVPAFATLSLELESVDPDWELEVAS